MIRLRNYEMKIARSMIARMGAVSCFREPAGVSGAGEKQERIIVEHADDLFNEWTKQANTPNAFCACSRCKNSEAECNF